MKKFVVILFCSVFMVSNCLAESRENGAALIFLLRAFSAMSGASIPGPQQPQKGFEVTKIDTSKNSLIRYGLTYNYTKPSKDIKNLSISAGMPTAKEPSVGVSVGMKW